MNKILFFLLVISSACSQGFDEKRVKLSKEVRSKYSKHLKKLPPLNYSKIFGSLPNKDRLELGRQLFNDPILSRNNDVSCATCHLSNHGFADGNSLSVGTLGKGGPNGNNVGKSFGEGVLNINRGHGDDGHGFEGRRFMFRNTLSTINVGYRIDKLRDDGLFWDGRFGNLNFQALLPIHTPEEMCGTNPVPNIDFANYLFGKNGPIFKEPILVKHSHSYDSVTGADTGSFNFKEEYVAEIPMLRPNGVQSVPTRNECTALMISKIRLVPGYRELFKKAFNDGAITDLNIGKAIAAFMTTHVSKNTSYDKFVAGENSLTVNQLKGFAIFSEDFGKEFMLGDEKLKGAGCIHCHAPPTFGGDGFYSLGVVSDSRSSLSKPKDVFTSNSGFFDRKRLIRGEIPRCHIEGASASNSYAPDIGRASASFKSEDCFKFRVPPLRNVIETYPYFHHGTGRGQGYQATNFKERSRVALESVIRYHLRGPVSSEVYAQKFIRKKYFDKYFQKDPYLSVFRQNFIGMDKEKYPLETFPIKLSDSEIEYLLSFIAEGLYDPMAVQVGDLGNDISHPKDVLSGFRPSVTRDEGHQNELPPNRDIEKIK